MTAIRDRIAQFLASEGHRADISERDGEPDTGEIIFRTRGQTFSIVTSERDPHHYTISTAYEVPDSVHDSGRSLDALSELDREYPLVRFALAHDETLFVATIDCEANGVDAFVNHFWQIVGELRSAASTALESMVDRTESKAAADKFIRQFTASQRDR